MSGCADTPDVVELARNHDLDQKDVARVLHFCCPAMPVANSKRPVALPIIAACSCALKIW
jgi:hypothetical protein